jgi:mRNA interferase HicA
VKKKDLERQLRESGWRFVRHGGSHDVWTNGEVLEFVPRHAEVKEMLARKILKKAKLNPPKEN